MKKFLLMPLLLTCVFIYAQTKFYSTIKVDFEKTVAVKGLFKEMWADWYDNIKDRLPQSVASEFEFIGDSTKSIYRQTKEAAFDAKSIYRPIADQNIVYNNYSNSTTVSQKPIFEETFLLQDSLLKIKWKITNDTRKIAGFDCRKAIGTLYDTVTVFAFYTDELMVTGGPEGINGLPGMILGTGIPRLHTTWFATKVQVVDVDTRTVSPPTKGKKMNRSTLFKSMDKVLSEWEYGKKVMLATMI